jgi:hypothetical protein
MKVKLSFCIPTGRFLTGFRLFILAAAQIQRHGAIDAIKRNFSKTSAQPLICLLDRVFPILENSIHE